jgi:hypothetical protein
MNTQTINPVLAGILKVPAEFLNLPSSCFYNELQAEAQKRNLKALSDEKWHCTLIHQSFLKKLSKAVKKGQELQFPTFPNLLFFNSKNNGEHIRMVMDVNPKSQEIRETLRLVLCETDQVALQQYVTEFCKINEIEIDDFEASRIFHISFANRTGLPGDSVR